MYDIFTSLNMATFMDFMVNQIPMDHEVNMGSLQTQKETRQNLDPLPKFQVLVTYLTTPTKF